MFVFAYASCMSFSLDCHIVEGGVDLTWPSVNLLLILGLLCWGWGHSDQWNRHSLSLVGFPSSFEDTF